MEKGNKRLVICCDGTWNEPDQEVHDNPADETEPTNVLKVVRGLAPVDGGQVPQVVYYDTGVGTQGLADKYAGGGLGSGLSENIQQAYRFIANNYREGDEFTDVIAGLDCGTADECRLEDSFSASYQALRLLRVRPYRREIGPKQCGDIRPCGAMVPGESTHPSAVNAIGKPFAGNPGNAPYEPKNLITALDDGLPIWRET